VERFFSRTSALVRLRPLLRRDVLVQSPAAQLGGDGCLADAIPFQLIEQIFFISSNPRFLGSFGHLRRAHSLTPRILNGLSICSPFPLSFHRWAYCLSPLSLGLYDQNAFKVPVFTCFLDFLLRSLKRRRLLFTPFFMFARDLFIPFRLPSCSYNPPFLPRGGG